TSISLAGTLTLTSGGLVTTGSSSVSISGGSISSPSGELILNTTTGSAATIVSPIVSAGLPATATVSLVSNSGQVFGIAVTNGGYGYTTVPTVTITSADGQGSGATGTAVLNSSGNVTAITITNPGSGYDVAPIISLPAPPLEQATASAALNTTNPPTQ